MLLWTGCNNPLCNLTPRKVELLEALVDNPAATNSDLAKRLHVSESAVKKYLQEIYRTIGVQNRSECLVLLLQKGLVIGGTLKTSALPKRSDYV